MKYKDSSVPIKPLNLDDNQHLSVNSLSEQLTKGRVLAYNSKSVEQWFNMDKQDIAELLQNEQINSESFEQCVLVGQSINLEVIEKIAKNIFESADLIIISAHHLNQQFAKQAIILQIFRANSDATGTQQVQLPQSKLINKDALLTISQQYFLDCFEVSNVYLSKPGLIVMDMDSTIINMECIDEIASLAGVGDKVSELTERAMQGELDFNQSLQARLSCLTGIEIAELEGLKSRLPINPGFAETMRFLKSNGWVTCIASGGFTFFADYLKDTFELSYAHSNVLSVQQGKLTGEVEGEIVNAHVKKEILLEKAALHNIGISQTIAIGDGANDLLMMQAAALGVAYKAKPKVQVAADANIHYCGFEGLLYSLKA